MAYIDGLREAQRKWRNVLVAIDRSGAYVNSRGAWTIRYGEGQSAEVSRAEMVAAMSPLTGGTILFGGRGGGKTELAQTVLYLTTGMTPEQIQNATLTGKQSQGNSYSIEMQTEGESVYRNADKNERKQGVLQKRKDSRKERVNIVPSEFFKSPAKIFDEIGELSPAEQVFYRRLLSEGVVELPDGTSYNVPEPWIHIATTNRGIAEAMRDGNIDIALLDRYATAVEVPQTGGFADRYSLAARKFQRVLETDVKRVLRDMGYPTRGDLLPSSMQEIADTIELIEQMPVADNLRYFADFLIAANSTCVRATDGDKVSGTKPIRDRSDADRCHQCPYNTRDGLSTMLTSGLSYRTMKHLLRTARAATFVLHDLKEEPVATLKTGESVAPSVILHRMLPTTVAADSTVADSRTELAEYITQRAAFEYNRILPVITAMIGGMNGDYDLTSDKTEGRLVRDALRRVDEVMRAEDERKAGRVEHPVTNRTTGDLVIQYHYAPILRDLTDVEKAKTFRAAVKQIRESDTKDPEILRRLEDYLDNGDGRTLSLDSRTHIKRNVLCPRFGVNDWMER